MERQRVGAVIIRNGKILMVRDVKAEFFSIPGGAIEGDEDHHAALARELREEIGVSLAEATYYCSFTHINQTYHVPQIGRVYLASITGEPSPAAEIRDFGWFSRGDLNGTVGFPGAFVARVLPKLLKEHVIA